MVNADEGKHSSSGLEFKLHPLVLINVSDHFTRLKANGPAGAQPPMVMGCLLGSQDGRTVDVSNSFEMKYTTADDGWQIDHPFLLKKQEQYKTVFPKQDIVGWYCTGRQVEERHLAVHRQVLQFNESPVFLLLNPFIDHARKDLPVDVYETELHAVDGVPQTVFVKANYSMETSDAERIGVDQVAKILPSGKASGSEQLNAHLAGLHSAIKMLSGKLGAIQQHLELVAQGELTIWGLGWWSCPNSTWDGSGKGRYTYAVDAYRGVYCAASTVARWETYYSKYDVYLWAVSPPR
eukprot:GHRR01025427.1.p1 GENE.GHRR01025427.1~~GHRR01025427.1.p1  ORF type:complete len:293 (+),score=67.89 GHRR01025427.1:194-1072(+)